MEGYPRRLPAAPLGDIAPGAGEIVNEAGSFLRRLIPLPGAEAFSPLTLLPLPQAGAAQANPVGKAVSDVGGEQAASLVSQAASILDEEMARGVLAARHSAEALPREYQAAPHGYPDPTNPVLRQVHDFVDSMAATWPSVPAAQRFAQALPAASDADPLAEVRPRTTVKPGQRATISMALRNSETQPVRLVPAATDLLGSRGGRIACSLLEFTPREFSLAPQEQRDLAIAMTVPLDAAPGCYSGLLVVTGLDYLRALITIEVV